VSTILLLKDVRLVFWNYLAGNPIKLKGIKTTSDGIPTILGDLIPLIRKGPSPVLLQIVNTILTSTRALKLGKSYDIENITKEPQREPIDISKYKYDF
jgi:hypothetical protein